MNNDDFLKRIQKFFPGAHYEQSNLGEAIDRDELDTHEESIANILKGVLLDETILEVNINDLKQVFNCRVLDAPPVWAEVDDDSGGAQMDFEPGSYLEDFEKLVITPLEPSLGNFIISNLNEDETRVLLKFVSKKNRTELACYFEGRVMIGDMPVLRLSFPFVARKTKEDREEFRAKVPKSLDFTIFAGREGGKKNFKAAVVDISMKGMGIIDPMGRKSDLAVGERMLLELRIAGEESVAVDATVCHVSKLRDAKGVQYCFGVEFDLSKIQTRNLIENIFALVQRAHLRELSDIADRYGIIFDDW